MLVPLNNLKRIVPQDASGFLASANEALLSGWWLNGQKTEAFCVDFASYLGVKHCIGVANGTDALEIALRALISVRNPDGREVITVPNAGGYSAIAAHIVGLSPVYADIEEHSQLVSIDSILSCVGPETAVVIATHLYGGAVDVPTLRDRLDTAGYAHVAILEDCAQAHGARIGGQRVGGLGDIATFSFYPTKNLGAFGDAGAIVTNDVALAQAANAVRQYGWSAKYTISLAYGRNSRIDEVQAALLSTLLPKLDAANARRVEILERYIKATPAEVTVVRASTDTVAHLVILLTEDRDNLRSHLTAKRIGTDIHYPVLDPDQPGWQELKWRVAPNGIPIARKSVERLLTIPCFPTMTDEEVDLVCDALASWKR